jgi:hypothetical protein
MCSSFGGKKDFRVVNGAPPVGAEGTRGRSDSGGYKIGSPRCKIRR